MTDTVLAAVLALSRVDPRPAHHLAEDLDSGADPCTLLERATSTDPHGQLALAPVSDPVTLTDQARDDLTTWAREGIAAVSVLDDAYPVNLRAVHDRPPLVFTRGDRRHLTERAVAVIGSRHASRQGLTTAAAVAHHLVRAQYTVVSGLAAGVDTAAHTAALDARAGTVAVIGTGLRHAYPPENAVLQATIADHGVVLSPFEPDLPPSRETFPIRNGVMSGLSVASVIVEAGERSGTRIQARKALRHGRAVFLARELVIQQAWARELSARPGVHRFDEPEQITATLDQLASPALRG